MSDNQLYNVNIASERLLAPPRQIKEAVPLTEKAAETVQVCRTSLRNILDRQDPRYFVVVGPCSIHDIAAAREYAGRLARFAEEVKDTFVLVMRVYFEKPRTAVGWKGFINDPYLDDTFRIEDGLRLSRELLLEVAELGIGAATEALDPIMPQYLHDLISWTAIGARTTESQTHREMASGLSTPVGFKNGTDGNIQVALNALISVSRPHRFLGINQEGQCAVMGTRGNKHAHIVLRGGIRPNYDSVNILQCEREMTNANLPATIVVDCSHGNSLKDPALQPLVLENCSRQIESGNQSIVGFMLESNLQAGNQTLKTKDGLEYGVSITDGCLDWETTVEAISKARDLIRPVVRARGSK